MRRFTRFYAFLLAVAFLTLSLSSTALAYEELWDKGRSYGTFLSGSNMNKEMNVMSCGANKTIIPGNPYDYLSGVERVRAWGRKESIEAIYPTHTYTCWVNGSSLRLYSNDSRNAYVYITGHNPPNASNADIPTYIWDILGYIPTGNMLRTYANNILGQKITSTTPGSWDLIKTFEGTVADKRGYLPSSYAYTNADASTDGTNGNGMVAWFGYDFKNPGSISSLKLWPQSRVRYAVYNNSTKLIASHWTNYAGVQHTVN